MDFDDVNKDAADSVVSGGGPAFDLDDVMAHPPATSLQEDEELWQWLNSFDEASGSMRKEFPNVAEQALPASPVPPTPDPGTDSLLKNEANAANAAAFGGWGSVLSWNDVSEPKKTEDPPPTPPSKTKMSRKKMKKGGKSSSDEGTGDTGSSIQPLKVDKASSGDDNDEDARAKKMKYNREAARRSRKRKRDQLESLQQRLNELEQENKILGLEVKNAGERSSTEQQLLMQSRMHTVRQVVDAFNKGIEESVRVASDVCVTDEIVFCSPDVGQIKGISNTLEYLKMLMEALPDVVLQVNSLKVENSSNKILMDWEIRGTHNGVLIGIPPTGLVINTQGSCEWSFVGKRVSRVSLVWKHGLAPLIKTIIGGLAGMASRAVQSVAGSVVGMFRPSTADTKK